MAGQYTAIGAGDGFSLPGSHRTVYHGELRMMGARGPDTSPEVILLDCTIRDGGFVNDFGFSIEEVKRHLAASSAIGYGYFEIGYLTDPSCLGPDDGVWRNVPFSLIETIRDQVEPRCKISVMVDIWRFDARTLPPRSETCVDLIRVCSYEENLDLALAACQHIRQLGYEVSLNLICISHIPDRGFEAIRARVVESRFLSYLSLADSYGAVTPARLGEILGFFRTIPELRLGFHGHDNMRLSMANSLAAIEQGVQLVDATYGGTGRGGGNLPLELITLYLHARLGHDFDIRRLVEHLDEMVHDHEQLASIKQAMCGILDIHPHRLRDMEHESLATIHARLLELPARDRARYRPSRSLLPVDTSR